MSYIGGNTLAAATALPMTSGALYLWTRQTNPAVAYFFMAVAAMSLIYTASVIVRYVINSKKDN